MAVILPTLGSDPELFKLSEEQVVPAHRVMGGDTTVALPYGEGYPDGAAIEFTVTPTTSPDEMVKRLWANMETLQERFGPLSAQSRGFIPAEEINKYGEECGRGAMTILGCNQDNRVYPWVDEVRRPDPTKYEYRTLGGHVHAFVGERVLADPDWVLFYVSMLDQLLGTAGVYLADDPESKARQELYGKAGTYRSGKGLVEYRTLPAKVLLVNREVSRAVFEITSRVSMLAQQLAEQDDLDTALGYLGGLDTLHAVQEAIDGYDQVSARRIQQEAAKRLQGTEFDVSVFVTALSEARLSNILMEA